MIWFIGLDRRNIDLTHRMTEQVITFQYNDSWEDILIFKLHILGIIMILEHICTWHELSML